MAAPLRLLLLLALLLQLPPRASGGEPGGGDGAPPDAEREDEPAGDGAAEEEAATAVDSADSRRLTRLAFGACSKQYMPQPLWEPIARFQPDAWVWAGDAIYKESGGRGGVPEQLGAGYAQQLLQPGYAALLRSGVRVHGTWDDHDFGRNDAGRWFAPRRESQQLYLDFIEEAQTPVEVRRRAREGVYAAHTFGAPPQQVKLLLLDTRYSRDSHIIPSVGGVRLPLSPVVAAAIRGLCSYCSIGADYGGDVLGEAQWAWLEAQLAESEAAIHIIVSSVQVQTSNPLVESWGHFPAARARLVALLAKHRPAGLLLLSGDVHFAEMSGRRRPDGSPSFLLEATSSGMTHTCASAPVYGGVCASIIRRYAAHRTTADAHYPDINWGTVEIEWPHEDDDARNGSSVVWPRAVVSIRGADGEAVLQETVPPGRAPAGESWALEPLVPEVTVGTAVWCGACRSQLGAGRRSVCDERACERTGIWMWLSFIGVLGALLQCISMATGRRLTRGRSLTPDLPTISTEVAKSVSGLARAASQGKG